MRNIIQAIAAHVGCITAGDNVVAQLHARFGVMIVIHQHLGPPGPFGCVRPVGRNVHNCTQCHNNRCQDSQLDRELPSPFHYELLSLRVLG